MCTKIVFIPLLQLFQLGSYLDVAEILGSESELGAL